jgi:predicted chitinase
MAKIILTENQLIDLIKNAVGKIIDLPKSGDFNLKDLLNKLDKDDIGSDVKEKITSLTKKFGNKTNFGKVKLVDNFNSEQKSNISHLIDLMNSKGIKNPYTQIGILSVIGKESNFIPKSEVNYSNTPNNRIRNIFGDRVPREDSKLDRLKKNPRKFFDVVYGGRLGNDSDEGYKYRGRGFNQLTFKGNYEKYGSMAGVDIVSNPDKLNDPNVAAKVALAFFTKGKPVSSFPDFSDKDDAAKYFADINSGGGVSSHRQKAIDYSEKFDVV